MNDCNPIITYESFADVRAVVAGRAVVIDVVIVVSAAFENERGPSSAVGDAVAAVVRGTGSGLAKCRSTDSRRDEPPFAEFRSAASCRCRCGCRRSCCRWCCYAVTRPPSALSWRGHRSTWVPKVSALIAVFPSPFANGPPSRGQRICAKTEESARESIEFDYDNRKPNYPRTNQLYLFYFIRK